MKNRFKNKTVCKNCRWHIRETDSNIWYYQKCSAAPPNIEVDYVIGEVREINQFCRDVNEDGECEYYRKA